MSFNSGNILLRLVLKAVCGVLIYIILCFIIFNKTDEFIFLKEKIINLIKQNY